MLKSEILEAELLAITAEVQRLVELRRSPTLQLTYQEQWNSTPSLQCLSLRQDKDNSNIAAEVVPFVLEWI